MADLNMTETRLAGLRIIKDWPGMYVAEICNHLFEGGHIVWKRKDGPSAQAAARWSGQFVSKLVQAGLVKTPYAGDTGRRSLYITEAGLEKIGYGKN